MSRKSSSSSSSTASGQKRAAPAAAASPQKKKRAVKLNINSLDCSLLEGKGNQSAVDGSRRATRRATAEDEIESSEYEFSDESDLSESGSDEEMPATVDLSLENEEAINAWTAMGLGGIRPEQHVLSRERAVRTTKKRGRGKVKKSNTNRTDPKGVSAAVRIREFPGSGLCVQDGKLWCPFCCGRVSLKK